MVFTTELSRLQRRLLRLLGMTNVYDECSTGRISTERSDAWRNADSGVDPGIPRRKADRDQAGGAIQ